MRIYWLIGKRRLPKTHYENAAITICIIMLSSVVKILKEAVRKHGIELKGWIWGRDFKIGY